MVDRPAIFGWRYCHCHCLVPPLNRARARYLPPRLAHQCIRQVKQRFRHSLPNPELDYSNHDSDTRLFAPHSPPPGNPAQALP